MWDTILFDLDGTLTDSQVGILNALRFALDRFGLCRTEEELRPFLGPPLHETFPALGFDAEETREAIRVFRLYYTDKGWVENTPYPGVGEMLAELKSAGVRLLVATSKPKDQAVRILTHFGLAGYFQGIFGPEGGEEARKGQVIARALEEFPGAGALMVGDRRHDVAGAAENGLPCLGVLYGYGSREELETAGAKAIAVSVEELKNLLLAGLR